jgi:hypothetical protein
VEEELKRQEQETRARLEEEKQQLATEKKRVKEEEAERTDAMLRDTKQRVSIYFSFPDHENMSTCAHNHAHYY